MTLCCGIDLHANNVVVSIINDNDIVVFEKPLALAKKSQEKEKA